MTEVSEIYRNSALGNIVTQKLIKKNQFQNLMKL